MATPPTPVLSPLTAGDGFLIADWTNMPYIDINNAYLLVVNRNNYSDIQYIYLTETQALETTYKISGLTNGTPYMVQYTQTQLAPDGIQGSSGTQIGTPLATPEPPVLQTAAPYPVVVDFNESTGKYSFTMWANYPGPYSPDLEQTIFKLVGQNTASIASVTFPITSVPAPYVQYSFTDLVADTYSVSAFNVNNHGVGRLSNVVNVYAGQLPFITDVTQVVSGQDSKLTVSVNTPQNIVAGNNITEIIVYYSTNNIAWVEGARIPSSAFAISSGTITASVDVPSLTNGTGYYIKAAAVNANGTGPSGAQGTGVPAIKPVVTTVTITNAQTTGGLFSAEWSYTQGTFVLPLSYNYVLTQDGTAIVTPVTGYSGTTLSLTGLSLIAGASLVLTVTPVATVHPPDVLAFWTNPTLSGSSTPADQWVGSATASPAYIVNDRPSPPSGFVCNLASDGLLGYTWTPSSGVGYNAATGYSITLTGIDGTTKTVGGGSTNNVQFTGLTNDTNYTATIVATNAYGSSTAVATVGSNQPLFNIIPVTTYVGPVQGVPLPSGKYPISVNWPDFVQTGYTLHDYGVSVYSRLVNTDPWELISGFPIHITSSQYTFVEAVQGVTYRFGVTNDAYKTQFGTSQEVFSDITYSSDITIGALPFISNVRFSTDASLNGIITFDVDNRGSDLKGLMSYVLPSGTSSVNPIQAPPNNYVPFIHASGPQTYSANLGYVIPSDPLLVSYLIYACNGIGGSFIENALE
jgi:hypothetical protein